MILGSKGERLAARFLKRRGYRLLARNYTCPVGEIDVIAQDGDTLVFVEVKTRRRGDAAPPEINVHFAKQRKLTQVARHFLIRHTEGDPPCRFDVVAIVLPRWGRAQVEHFVDAFAPAGGRRR